MKNLLRIFIYSVSIIFILLMISCKSVSKKSKTSLADSAGASAWSKSKNVNANFGLMKLRLKTRFGSYSISLSDSNGKTIPVLSTANEFTTNSFYLKTPKKVYALSKDTSVKIKTRKKTDGASILYSIPKVADVEVDFTCVASEQKSYLDMFKVSVLITNKSGRTDEFIFKSILDTILGESDTYHFYTWDNVPIRNEVAYRTLQNQKWFTSRNNSAAMQIFYTGADCTVPSLVALANYSTLEKTYWEPDMLNFRAFDTVLSYNNSAICSVWQPMFIAPDASRVIVFYMAFAADGRKPSGEKLIYPEENQTQETEKLSASVSVPVAAEIMPETVVETEKAEPVVKADEDAVKTEPVAEKNENIPVVSMPQEPEKSVDVSEIPNVDFNIKNLTKEQLSPEYIQSLLDRIAALEEDSPSLNREELLKLNSELDAILSYLRQ